MPRSTPRSAMTAISATGKTGWWTNPRTRRRRSPRARSSIHACYRDTEALQKNADFGQLSLDHMHFVPVLKPIAGHVIQFGASHGWPPFQGEVPVLDRP